MCSWLTIKAIRQSLVYDIYLSLYQELSGRAFAVAKQAFSSKKRSGSNTSYAITTEEDFPVSSLIGRYGVEKVNEHGKLLFDDFLNNGEQYCAPGTFFQKPTHTT